MFRQKEALTDIFNHLPLRTTVHTIYQPRNAIDPLFPSANRLIEPSAPASRPISASPEGVLSAGWKRCPLSTGYTDWPGIRTGGRTNDDGSISIAARPKRMGQTQVTHRVTRHADSGVIEKTF